MGGLVVLSTFFKRHNLSTLLQQGLRVIATDQVLQALTISLGKLNENFDDPRIADDLRLSHDGRTATEGPVVTAYTSRRREWEDHRRHTDDELDAPATGDLATPSASVPANHETHEANTVTTPTHNSSDENSSRMTLADETLGTGSPESPSFSNRLTENTEAPALLRELRQHESTAPFSRQWEMVVDYLWDLFVGLALRWAAAFTASEDNIGGYIDAPYIVALVLEALANEEKEGVTHEQAQAIKDNLTRALAEDIRVTTDANKTRAVQMITSSTKTALAQLSDDSRAMFHKHLLSVLNARAPSLHCTVLSGGNSNAMYKISLHRHKESKKSNQHESRTKILTKTWTPLLKEGVERSFGHADAHHRRASVVLRIYGEGIQNRQTEILMAQLLSRPFEPNGSSLSPAILSVYEWGRVEAFLDDVEVCGTPLWHQPPLSSEQLTSVLNDISLTLAQCHVSLSPKQFFDEKRRLNSIENEQTAKSKDAVIGSTFFVYLRKMLGICATFFPEKMKDREGNSFLCRDEFVSAVNNEIEELEAKVAALRSPIVVCHNDMNPGNALFRPLDKAAAIEAARNLKPMRQIYLLDFEYSDLNLRGYDIGNMMCEMDYDYLSGSPEGFEKVLWPQPDNFANSETLHGILDMNNAHTSSLDRWSDKAQPRMAQAVVNAEHRGRERAASEGLDGSFDENDAPRDLNSNSRQAMSPKIGSSSSLDEPTYQPQNKIGEHIISQLLTPYMMKWNASDRRCLRLTDKDDDTSNSYPPTIPSVRDLTREALHGMLLSHLGWSLWSVIMACGGVTARLATHIEDALKRDIPDVRQHLKHLQSYADSSEVSFSIGASGLQYVPYAECRFTEYILLKEYVENLEVKTEEEQI